MGLRSKGFDILDRIETADDNFTIMYKNVKLCEDDRGKEYLLFIFDVKTYDKAYYSKNIRVKNAYTDAVYHQLIDVINDIARGFGYYDIEYEIELTFNMY